MSADTAPTRHHVAPVVSYPDARSLSPKARPEPGSATPAQIEAYVETVAPVYRRFSRQLAGWSAANHPSGRPGSQGPDIGLLTFPNSGTSWFARVALAATGICRHTVYRHESGRPVASRGFYALHPGTAAALPADDDPVVVKTHVCFFAGGRNERVADRPLDDLTSEWKTQLPSFDRSIRLLRNPVDNLRARYHHYLKKDAALSRDGRADPVLPFQEFVNSDITNYLLWHTCCDRSTGEQVLTVDYDALLVGGAAPFATALDYAGYRTEIADVARALKLHPARYRPSTDPSPNGVDTRLPVHLRHYTVDDLTWLASQMEAWLDS